ncbi:MAG TPA: hypothetical protein DDW71_06655 [Lactobacillus sp.]|nr:hypothetical protein [Lactobacillus sp.]
MDKKVWKRVATVVLSASLVGGVFVEVPNALTTTQAQASTTRSYSQFKTDLSALKKAVSLGNSGLKKSLNSTYFSNMEKNPLKSYDWNASPAFAAAVQTMMNQLQNDLDSNGRPTSAFKADFAAVTAFYNYLLPQLPREDQDSLSYDYRSIENAINTGKYYDHGIRDSIENNFGPAFYQGVTDITPSKITGMPASTKKSYISKLSVKKTSSKKYVKTTGSAKLYKSAKYVRVHTYKGNGYAKLSSKHNFSKTVYAPKAKTVKVTVGNYSHGHFTSVTSTKTVHIK